MNTFEQWLIGKRRDFHRHPELAFEETRTSQSVAETLTELDLEVRTGFGTTGVVGILRGQGAGKTIALRADMDALPIEEGNDVEYRSQTPGVMHACGHDAHTAIVLGVARHMVENNFHEELNGDVVFLFQPAEEGVRGARAMIEDGVLNVADIDVMLACHVSNGTPVGTIGICNDISHAASDRFSMTVRARGGHAAYPDTTSDAIVASCFFVTQIQTIVARNVGPTESAVVSVGALRGGTASNILPTEVLLQGTVRAFNEEVRQLVKKRLRDCASSLKFSFALDAVDFEYEDGCPPCVNDPGVVARVRSAAEDVVGEDHVECLRPKMGAEDFAYFAQKIPAAMFRLGTGNPDKGITAGGHQPLFDIDEDGLIIGVQVFLSAIRNYLSTGRRPRSRPTD